MSEANEQWCEARTREADLTDVDRAVTYLTNNAQYMRLRQGPRERLADRHGAHRGRLPPRHRGPVRHHRSPLVARRRRGHPQTPRRRHQWRPPRLPRLLQAALPARAPPHPLRPRQHPEPRPHPHHSLTTTSPPITSDQDPVRHTSRKNAPPSRSPEAPRTTGARVSRPQNPAEMAHSQDATRVGRGGRGESGEANSDSVPSCSARNSPRLGERDRACIRPVRSQVGASSSPSSPVDAGGPILAER